MSEPTNIIKLSDEILNYLLSFKETHPDFTFSLRQRNSAQNSEENRLEKGQWFQGSDYIYLPLFNRGDNARKIKTIGFVIWINEQGKIGRNYLEISFKSGDYSTEDIAFHKEIADFAGVKLGDSNHGQIDYPTKDIWKNLENYISDFRDHALQLLKKLKIEDKYIISEQDFEKRLKKTQSLRKSLVGSGNNNTSNKNEDEDENENKKHPLNQILYGPPGTGKTYATKELAVKIANPKFVIDVTLTEAEQRMKVTNEYQKLYEAGQIVFTTFHQSMSYEDFVEGIKPETLDNDVVYNVQPGLFKLLCEKAGIKSNSNFDEVLEQFKNDIVTNQPFTINTGRSKFDVFYRGGLTFRINPHDSTNVNPNYPASIENLLKFYQTESIEGIYNPSYIRGIVNHLYDKYGLIKYNNVAEAPDKNHVLIIDEINRGNVSAIFGELITLLEEDKRLGKPEEVLLKLPYSKTDFGVPSNLYIIGTMNTADRSVEALDTALRRRFSFVEVMPEPSLLSPSAMICSLLWKHEDKAWNNKEYLEPEQRLFNFLGVSEVLLNARKNIWAEMQKSGDRTNIYFQEFVYTGFNLEKILISINSRIEALLDRDHTIGHSYFLKVNDNASLIHAFKNSIIPLLQEYFYGDYEKLNLVLGDGFIIKDTKNEVVFAGKNNPGYATANKYDFIDLNESNIEAAVKLLLNFEEPKQKDEAAPAQ
jgi:5-methylcytosine-specific restriction endonuclease McrBC GTP-binding regulatory subunit McrB